MAFMLFMRSFVRREIEDVERSLVEVQDFTVRIQNMPSLKQFQQYSTIELKAALAAYLTRKVDNIGQQNPKLAESKIEPTELVTINFGTKKVTHYNLLQKILKLKIKNKGLQNQY